MKAVLHAYQRIGVETSNRILALVATQDSYAVFSFALACDKPRTFSDLVVDNIFPIDKGFRMESEVRNTISVLGFSLSSSQTARKSTFYPSHPDDADEYTSFKLLVDDIFDYKVRNADTYPQAIVPPPFDDDESGTGGGTTTDESGFFGSEKEFSWLARYRREDDLLAIDRCIADGSKPLLKGESKFQYELKKHEHEYIINKTYRIYCATWNVNGQQCNATNLRPWLAASEDPPDIYAIAFQELDLSPKAITLSESRPDRSVIHNIMKSLHEGAQYEELCSVRLVGMMLTIVVKRSIRPNITRCEKQSVGTGALNLMGNKGGVGVSLTLNEDSLCFVNSHLAAHVSEVQRRNEDFNEINRRLLFSTQDISNHDHIFWIGDLNYRLNMTSDEITDYRVMLKFDQLNIERAAHRVFENYYEGEITFQPTYKYDPGTDNWDSSEKHRQPAWCDRILWRGDKIKQIVYRNVMKIQLSDHKPVYATFLAEIKTKDEQKYKRVHEKILKRVDKYENDNQPQITVEKTDLDFEEIKFNEEYFRDFTVANNCHLPVEFSFKEKTETDMRICEDWISIDPCYGTLITGRSLSIRVKIHIKSETVWRVIKKQGSHLGKIPLDILVLHVKNGRDIFITVMGEYKPSCFGLPVETLCRLDKPIVDMQWSELTEIQMKSTTEPFKITMPREIFLLIDYLYRVGMQEINLFQLERSFKVNDNINEIRDWLDSCGAAEEFPGTPHTAAEALLMLLESSGNPLIHPLDLNVLNPDYPFELCLRAIHKLSTPRKNVFLYLTMFLHEFIEQNRNANIEVIAKLFGMILIRSSHDIHGLQRKNFIKRFLSRGIFNFARNEFKYS